MNYVKLGNSDLMVSPICTGCMSFGDSSQGMFKWALNEEDSAAMVKHALDLGINFFDTANTYSAGTSEEYLGRAIKKYTSRDKVILASKVYFNDGKLSREAINREIEGTLKRLDTDYLDLYIIHRFDYSAPIEETMEALHNLVKAGKVRALGASAMFAYQFYTMQLAARDNGWTPFVSMQNHYNLLNREEEREMNPLCDQMGVARTPYSPLASGHLCRPNWDSESLRSQTDYIMARKYNSTKNADMEIVKRVHELSEKYGVTMTQIALAWHFAKGVTSVLIGATKPKYLDDAVGSLNVKLSAEDITYLEEPYVPHELMGVVRQP